MQNPNLPPGAQPVPAGGQPPQKLTKEQKKALAEQQKRIEQEKMRAMELSKLVANFNRELEESVIDPPLMYKLATNKFKQMLKCDHASAAMFEEYPQLGQVCIIHQQSNLPPKPPEAAKPGQPAAAATAEAPATASKAKKKDKEDDKPKIPVPKPLPKEPAKPGHLPDLEGVFINTLAVIEQVRSSRQPLMIPDASKFAEVPVQQFATAYGIKSMLLLPVVVSGEVQAIITLYTVNAPHAYNQIEMTHISKAVEILARSVETAPPILPDDLKEKFINPVIRGDNSAKQIEYYSGFMDDIYEFMIGELEEQEAQELLDLQAAQSSNTNVLRKVWYQLGKALELQQNPKMAYLFSMALAELSEQAVEYAKAKDGAVPKALEQLKNVMHKILKFNSLYDLLVADKNTEEEDTTTIEEMAKDIEAEVAKAVRGQLLFNDERRATLINDIEQSEMLANFVSVTAASNFRNNVRTNITDAPDDVDAEILLNDLCHFGLRELSLAVAQNIAEKYLYELEGFLEQPDEQQKDQMDKIKDFVHFKVMANLTPTLRGKPSLWTTFVQEKIKEKADKAAKQRAVLVGRLVKAAADEEEDWGEEEEEEE